MEAKSKMRRPKLGLVIGSGGIKGVAVLGLLKALERERIEIDLTVGCSAGSIYAAAFALGWHVKAMEERSFQLWEGLFTRHDWRALLRAMLPRVFGFDENFGVVNDRKINAVLQALFGDKTFADTQIPLHIVASDLRTGEKVVLSEGRIADAVRASIAIPVVLRPWRVNGRLLIDGGTTDPLPVDVAIREECETILAMGFEGRLAPRINSLMSLIDQTGGIVMASLLKSTYAFYNLAHDAEIIPLLVTLDRPVGLGDTHLIPYLIEQGEKAAKEQLPYLRKLLEMTNAKFVT